MGVHGNGLTSLVWMKPNPRSTVMEFFYPQGFAHDYEYTARALGMMHYGFWNNECATSLLSPRRCILTLFRLQILHKPCPPYPAVCGRLPRQFDTYRRGCRSSFVRRAHHVGWRARRLADITDVYHLGFTHVNGSPPTQHQPPLAGFSSIPLTAFQL